MTIIPGKIGKIKQNIIELLELSISFDTPIFIGESNIKHMVNKHPYDFQKYSQHIEIILDSPDYVGINPKDCSIEYVKEFQIDNEFVKVAVRISTSGKYFVRSLYILNNNRVKNFIAKGTLKPLTKTDT